MANSPQGECPIGDYERAGRKVPQGSASESPAPLSCPHCDGTDAVKCLDGTHTWCAWCEGRGSQSSGEVTHE